MELLAIVKEVHAIGLKVVLPNNIPGYVSITEISDQISDLVQKASQVDEDDDDTEAVISFNSFNLFDSSILLFL